MSQKQNRTVGRLAFQVNTEMDESVNGHAINYWQRQPRIDDILSRHEVSVTKSWNDPFEVSIALVSRPFLIWTESQTTQDNRHTRVLDNKTPETWARML